MHVESPAPKEQKGSLNIAAEISPPRKAFQKIALPIRFPTDAQHLQRTVLPQAPVRQNELFFDQ